MDKIDFKLVAQLRKTTGAGLNICKKALEKAKGDIKAAMGAIKQMGQTIVDSRINQSVKQGMIQIKTQPIKGSKQKRGMIIECNCETDFVASNPAFQTFLDQVAEVGVQNGTTTVEKLLSLNLNNGINIEQARKDLVAQMKENIQLTRLQLVETTDILGHYVHKGQYGCLVVLKGINVSESLAKEIAVHVVVNNPDNLNDLLAQDFYKESSKSVAKYLEAYQAEITEYVYFRLGER